MCGCAQTWAMFRPSRRQITAVFSDAQTVWLYWLFPKLGKPRSDSLVKLVLDSIHYDILCSTLPRPVEIRWGSISQRNTARLRQRV